MPSRTAKRDTDWFPHFVSSGTTASLGVGGEVTIVDIEIENRGTGVAYGGGAIVGMRLWLSVDPGADLLGGHPVAMVMIIPAGLAVPSLNTVSELKQAESFEWFWFPLMAKAGEGIAVTYSGEAHIKTARRFKQADRVIVLVMNNSQVAFDAASDVALVMDAYVKEG